MSKSRPYGGADHYCAEQVEGRRYPAGDMPSRPLSDVRPSSYPLNLICFRLVGSDSRNEELLQMLNRSGKLYLSHTKLNGKYTLRFCVGQTTTELHHVETAWSEIRSTANLLDTKGSMPSAGASPAKPATG